MSPLKLVISGFFISMEEVEWIIPLGLNFGTGPFIIKKFKCIIESTAELKKASLLLFS
jgi:hypothetical protein